MLTIGSSILGLLLIHRTAALIGCSRPHATQPATRYAASPKPTGQQGSSPPCQWACRIVDRFIV
ncbi:hypothetical protein [Actinoplanes sp. NPDC051859]|uniref:hypothetical protein n=1 Tax=Actinoplanes sp. NPDC051859 TaxID=3363909 RepID=UPI0037925056